MTIKALGLSLLILLTAGSAWGGPLETSFSPLIPEGLNFCASPETVEEKMGRPPGEQKALNDGILGYAYDFGYPAEVVEIMKGERRPDDDYRMEKSDLPLNSLYYFFRENKLAGIMLYITDCPDDDGQSPACGLRKLEAEMEASYGAPKTVSMRTDRLLTPLGLDPVGPFDYKLWELKSNAILASPVYRAEGPSRFRDVLESLSFMTIMVIPLSPDGQYDADNFLASPSAGRTTDNLTPVK